MYTKRLIVFTTAAILSMLFAAGCSTTDTTNTSEATATSNTVANNSNSSSVGPTANDAATPVITPAVNNSQSAPVKSGSPAPQTAKIPDHKIGSGGNDFYLFSKIRGQINEDAQLKNTNLVVNINDGVVTLTGTVANPEQKAQAEQLAHGVEGVKGIKNQLRISTGKN